MAGSLCVGSWVADGCDGARSGGGRGGGIGWADFDWQGCCAFRSASCSCSCSCSCFLRAAASSCCFFCKASASRCFRRASSSSLLRRASSSCCFFRRASSSLLLCCSSHSLRSRSCRSNSCSGVRSTEDAGFDAGGGIAIGSEELGGFLSSAHLGELEKRRRAHLLSPLLSVRGRSMLPRTVDAWRC